MFNEISLGGFFPGFGVFPDKHCVYVCALLLGSFMVMFMFISLNKFFMFSVNCFTAAVNS